MTSRLDLCGQKSLRVIFEQKTAVIRIDDFRKGIVFVDNQARCEAKGRCDGNGALVFIPGNDGPVAEPIDDSRKVAIVIIFK